MTLHLAVGLIAIILLIFKTFRRIALRRRLAEGVAEAPMRWHLALEAMFVILAIVCMFCSLRGRGDGRTQIVFMLDCSASMMANDNGRTRLDEGKEAILSLLDACGKCELGLVTYAGTPFVDYPLSCDRAGFVEALRKSAPANVTGRGSLPELALQQAEMLIDSETDNGYVVWVSDCEMEVSESAEAIWRERRHPLLVICCGTPGVPVPVPNVSGSDADALTVPSPEEARRVCLIGSPFSQTLFWNMDSELMRWPRKFMRFKWSLLTHRGYLIAAIAFLFIALWIDVFACWRMKIGLLMIMAVSADGADFSELRAKAHDIGLAREERVVCLNNLAAELCKASLTDEASALQYSQEAIEACQEALKLLPGLEPAAVNLELALRIFEAQQEAKSGKSSGNGRRDSVGNNSSSATAEVYGKGKEEDKNDSNGIGSWRDIKEAQAKRNIRQMPSNIKPW